MRLAFVIIVACTSAAYAAPANQAKLEANCMKQANAVRDARRTVDPVLRLAADNVASDYRHFEAQYIKHLKTTYVRIRRGTGSRTDLHSLWAACYRFRVACERVLKSAGVQGAQIGETRYNPLQSIIDAEDELWKLYNAR
jgi:hypothetical protein